MSETKPAIKLATLAENEADIRAIRHAVFVVGQAVPEELECDGADLNCHHALAYINNRAVATGRMQEDGHIGRIAVLEAYRGLGLGHAIMRFFVSLAEQQGLDLVYLNAQVQAMGFYEKLGFQGTGERFTEAGIEHIRMEKSLSPARN